MTKKITESLAIAALETIAGERLCINALLSDKDIAREALAILRAQSSAADAGERVVDWSSVKPEAIKSDPLYQKGYADALAERKPSVAYVGSAALADERNDTTADQKSDICEQCGELLGGVEWVTTVAPLRSGSGNLLQVVDQTLAPKLSGCCCVSIGPDAFAALRGTLEKTRHFVVIYQNPRLKNHHKEILDQIDNALATLDGLQAKDGV